MKYFKYWVKERFQIKIRNGKQEIGILAGSNISKDDARRNAEEKSKKIETHIAENSSTEVYDSAIKEHVNKIINDKNIVTVCRYGAKVLNSTQYTILDLDNYPVDFFDIFRSLRKMDKKERIVFKFLAKVKKYPELGNDFRIYETSKGVRVIGKKYLDPSLKNYSSIMKSLAVDWLYINLSQKQQCYRARITPKPHRMKISTIKVKTPLTCETEAYREWERQYERAARNYTVVKLIKKIGQDFSADPAIRLHDSSCNIHKNYALA